MVPSSKDVVRVTSNHLVLIGVPDHITFPTKVLGDNTWKVSVTSSGNTCNTQALPDGAKLILIYFIQGIFMLILWGVILIQ